MNITPATVESEVLYEFALGYQHPDPERLDEYVRAHPAYADALTLLAIELVIDRLPAHAPKRATPDATAEELLSKAMSHLQNRLYAVHAARSTPHAQDQRPEPRDLFASRDPSQMRVLVTRLDVSALFIRRMRDCEIAPETMTPGFIRAVADALAEPEAQVAHYFGRSAARISPQVHYKSMVKPTVGRQLSFEEAVRSSGLTADQQARLLAL